MASFLDSGGLVLRLLLIGVFALAAYAKTVRLESSRQSILTFGVPAPLAMILSVVLPGVEFMTALLLVFYPLLGSSAALALLVTFTAVISVSLLRGKKPSCSCFGNFSTAPVGKGTLLRNGALVLLALLALISAHRLRSSNQAITINSGEHVLTTAVLALVIILQAWFIFNLARQQGRLWLAIDQLQARLNHAAIPALEDVVDRTRVNVGALAEALEIGAVAPSFALPNMDGLIVSLEDLRTEGLPLLLVFTQPLCKPCMSLLPLIRRWQEDHSAKFNLAVISSGSQRQNRDKGLCDPIKNVLVQQEREINEAYLVSKTPSAILVDGKGRIQAQVAVGGSAITALVQGLAGTEVSDRASLRVGSQLVEAST